MSDQTKKPVYINRENFTDKIKSYLRHPGSMILMFLVMLATFITFALLLFLIFYILINGGTQLIRADRSPTYSMICMLTGTIINSLTILAGSAVGLVLRAVTRRSSKEVSADGLGGRLQTIIMQGMALCVLYIGVSGCLKGQNTLTAILSIALGAIIGELLDLAGGVLHLVGDLANLVGGRGDFGAIAVTEQHRQAVSGHHCADGPWRTTIRGIRAFRRIGSAVQREHIGTMNLLQPNRVRR